MQDFERRRAALADRWELDAAFRRWLSTALGALGALALVGCLLTGWLTAGAVAARLGGANGSTGAGLAVLGTNRANPTFVVGTPVPQDAATPADPILEPTTTFPAPTATGQATAAPGVTPTAPSAVPPTGAPGGCPPTSPPPPLQGGLIADGTAPSPMVAGCLATLSIAAPRHPRADVSITLTFGNIGQPNCTVVAGGATTDAQGNASLTFTVPPSTCFRGTVLTSGTILVGADASANANLPATSG